MSDLLVPNENGLFCAAGDFYIDPWRGVERAVITHAHADHSRWGSQKYLASTESVPVMKRRLGEKTDISGLDYGEKQTINGVQVSFHPAGHVLGSAQVRVEHQGEVWVASGDYKLDPDRTCAQFEPVRCHAFITESTFGLPIYHWPDQDDVFDSINRWWSENAKEQRASIIFVYGFGKAQRVLSGLDTSIGPIYCHGSVEKINEAYRDCGVNIPDTEYAGRADKQRDWGNAIILAPPSAQTTTWIRKFGAYSSAFASGWMTVRGQRRRRNVDRGFVLSDHADWSGLLTAIDQTKAERVLVTHGYQRILVQWLRGKGKQAQELQTRYVGELDDSAGDDDDSSENDSAAETGKNKKKTEETEE